MAGKVEMKDEIIKGIFGGLAMVAVVVAIGSLIGSALSPGPKTDAADGTTTEAPAAAAAGGEASAPAADGAGSEAPKE